MVPSRRAIVASAIAVIAIVATCLALFLPKGHGKAEIQPKVDMDTTSVSVMSDYPEDGSIFQTSITSINPIITSTASSDTLAEGVPENEIAKGAQVGADGAYPDCTVPLESTLESFIYSRPECRVIFLLPNGPIGYNLMRQINITRPLTIIGNPVVRPIVRALTASVMFRIFPNASLDMRFISLGMGIGSPFPTYDGILWFIQGGTFYVDFWGRLETTACDISTPDIIEPMIAAVDASGTMAELRMAGALVYAEGGVLTFTRTDFIVLMAYPPSRRLTLHGALLLNMFGDIILNQCSILVSIRSVNPDVLGAILTTMDGTVTINGGRLQQAYYLTRIVGAGLSYYIGGKKITYFQSEKVRDSSGFALYIASLPNSYPLDFFLLFSK